MKINLFLFVLSVSAVLGVEQKNSFQNQTLKEMNLSGLVKLEEVKVTGNVSIQGTLQAESSQMETLNVSGQARLNHCLIEGKTLVRGGLTLSNSTLKSTLDLKGKLEAEQSEIKRLQGGGGAFLKECRLIYRSEFNGAFSAEKTTFLEELTLKTTSATFKECTLSSLRILSPSKSEAQKVILEETTIEGTLVFESGIGEVILSPTSKVSEVRGGKRSIK